MTLFIFEHLGRAGASRCHAAFLTVGRSPAAQLSASVGRHEVNCNQQFGAANESERRNTFKRCGEAWSKEKAPTKMSSLGLRISVAASYFPRQEYLRRRGA